MAHKQHKPKNSKEFRESEKREERETLPGAASVESPDYMQLLKEGSGAALPAPVLVRAFRELLTIPGPVPGRLHRAAEATLERLLATERQNTYLLALRNKARKMTSWSDWFDVEYLIDEAKGSSVLR